MKLGGVRVGTLELDRGWGAHGPPWQVACHLFPQPQQGTFLPLCVRRVGCGGYAEGWCVPDPLCFVTHSSPLPTPVSGEGISQVERQWKRADWHRANEAARQPRRPAERPLLEPRAACLALCFKCY